MSGDSGESIYTSPYAHIRDALDYSYHSKPNNARLRVQDNYINTCLKQAYRTSSTPRLMFTAGAMGSGKSHYLSTLNYKFLLIDPDEISASIPNLDKIGTAYQRGSETFKGLERGTRLRHEARLITEVLLEAAMDRNADVVLDGSMRSYRWYMKQIPILREKYSAYRVYLVHVHCELQEVFRRAAHRSLRTGREIPKFLVERSWRDSRKAVSMLGRKNIVDQVILVDSTSDQPTIAYNSDNDPYWAKRGVPETIHKVDKLRKAEFWTEKELCPGGPAGLDPVKYKQVLHKSKL